MSELPTSAHNSIILRLRIEDQPGLLAQVVSSIGAAGGNIGAIDIVRYEKGRIIRDVTVATTGTGQAKAISDGLNKISGVKVMHSSDRVFVMHLGGKIEEIPITFTERTGGRSKMTAGIAFEAFWRIPLI